MPARTLMLVAALATSVLTSGCAEDEDIHGVTVEVVYSDDITDPDVMPGAGVAGANVTIWSWNDPEDSSQGTTDHAKGTTNANGVFIVDMIEPVEANVSANDADGSLYDCSYRGLEQVTLRDEGETVTVKLDAQACP